MDKRQVELILRPTPQHRWINNHLPTEIFQMFLQKIEEAEFPSELTSCKLRGGKVVRLSCDDKTLPGKLLSDIQ